MKYFIILKGKINSLLILIWDITKTQNLIPHKQKRTV